MPTNCYKFMRCILLLLPMTKPCFFLPFSNDDGDNVQASNCYNILMLCWTDNFAYSYDCLVCVYSVRIRKVFAMANVFSTVYVWKVGLYFHAACHFHHARRNKEKAPRWQYKFTLQYRPNVFHQILTFPLFCALKPRKMFSMSFFSAHLYIVVVCLRVFRRLFLRSFVRLLFHSFSHFSCHAIGYQNV